MRICEIVARCWIVSQTFSVTLAFLVPSASLRCTDTAAPDKGRGRWNHHLVCLTLSQNVNEQQANNWIERSDPLGADNFGVSQQSAAVAYFSLGIDGSSYELGELSKKFYHSMIKQAEGRFAAAGGVPEQLLPIYSTFAMDLSAKEATKAALLQNGIELIEEEGTTGQLWGEVENVRIVGYDEDVYDSFQDAAESGYWIPGNTFSFVVRNVQAQFSTVLQVDSKQSTKSTSVESLKMLGEEIEQRSNKVPTEASVRGYAPWKTPDIIPRSDLSLDATNVDGSENKVIAAKVFDGLKNHGYLIVDVGEGLGVGESEKAELAMAGMWRATQSFFETALDAEEKGDGETFMPAMKVAEGVGSRHAMYGYQSFENGAMRFLETRMKRNERSVLPTELQEIISEEDNTDITTSFLNLAELGKDVVRIATAVASIKKAIFASNISASDEPSLSGLNFDDLEVSPDLEVKAAISALRLASELVDDGQSCWDLPIEESPVSMSPHRMCCYSGKGIDSDAREVFGSHTDTSFITIVPVASVSGLEVFDESSDVWVRPELIARRHFEEERRGRGLDPNVEFVDSPESDNNSRPWHARYVVLMPGELLQLVTQGEINSAVHRVVAASAGKPRLSAPVLLRARTQARMDLARYYIDPNADPNEEKIGKLLRECDGMCMYDIHNALQPDSV